MISASDREKAVLLIKEAVSSGASLSKACEELGVNERTYYRWIRLKKETGSYDDLRPKAERKPPANKLTSEEIRTKSSLWIMIPLLLQTTLCVK